MASDSWWQFSINCQSSELELVEQLMLEHGALSISLGDAGDEPIYEPMPGTSPVWRESVVTATFDTTSSNECLYHRLTSALPQHLAGTVRQNTLQDRDWNEAYKQHFHPLQCAPGLWIVPSWCEPPEPDATVIRLDPGLAFGTGSHPTTALCLAWLGAQKPTGLSVIDFGCGSGILAIAAHKLGAATVTAVDIDAQALTACRSNMAANSIEPGQIRVTHPDDIDSTSVDLVVANILAGPLIRLAPRFAQLIVPGGQILLSGILKTQLKEIQLAYQPYFELDPASLRDEWVGISGIRIQQATHGT